MQSEERQVRQPGEQRVACAVERIKAKIIGQIIVLIYGSIL